MAQQQRKKPGGKGKQPISRHPLFPATVALWFGALFGLGSLAIRSAALEAAVLSTGLDVLVPAAAPPLGATARILMALAMAGLGGLIGAVFAARIARHRPEPRERRRGAVSSAGGFAAGERHESRRRPLAVEPEYAPAIVDEWAPLPGGAPQILNVAEFDFDGDDGDEGSPQPAAARAAPARNPDAISPLDLARFAQPGEPPQEVRLRPAHEGEGAAVAAVPAPISEPGDPAPAPAPAPDPAPAVARVAAADERPFSRLPFAASGEGADDAHGEDESLPERFEGLARMAPPLFAPRTAPQHEDAGIENERLIEQEAASAPRGEVPPVPEAHGVDDPAYDVADDAGANTPAALPYPERTATGFIPPVGSAAARIASADLEELSPVELIERLAISLQARREKAAKAGAGAPAAPPAASPALPDAPRAGDVALPTDTGPVEAPAIPIPAAMRPIGLDIHDDGEQLPPFVPMRSIRLPESPVAPLAGDEDTDAFDAMAEPAPALPGDDDGEESQALEDGYSSLLDLSRPANKQTFVRIEEPEPEDAPTEAVVLFPGQTVARGAFQPVAAPARPFDAPDAVPTVREAIAMPQRDPEETERALRAALATLQRMSGAA